MVNCLLCQQETDSLVNSHIIPRSLYGDILKDPTGPAKMIPEDTEDYIKISRTGVYDQIVCDECENLFGDWDQYAHTLFNEVQPDEIIRTEPTFAKDSKIVAYVYDDFDRHNLQMFLISLLWRAHTSTQDFFYPVQLGKYERKARQAILENNPNMFPETNTFISKFHNPIGGAQLNPYRQKLEGVNVYRFSFGLYDCAIKVDNLPFRRTFNEYGINTTSRLYFSHRDFTNSPEWRAIVNIAKERKLKAS